MCEWELLAFCNVGLDLRLVRDQLHALYEGSVISCPVIGNNDVFEDYEVGLEQNEPLRTQASRSQPAQTRMTPGRSALARAAEEAAP